MPPTIRFVHQKRRTNKHFAKVRFGVTFADDRQRHADEWWSVELAAATARRVSDMIAELGRRPLVRPDGPWRWRLSVGAKISYPGAAAIVTRQTSRYVLREAVYIRGVLVWELPVALPVHRGAWICVHSVSRLWVELAV